MQALHHDAHLRQARALAADGGPTTVTFHALDISSSASLHAFRDHLAAQYPRGIDLVVNNAGIALQGFDSTVVRDTLRTNYYGTLEASQLLLPLLRPDTPGGARLVNVSSTSGVLGDKYSPEVRAAFRAAAAGSDVAAVTRLMERFTAAVARGEEKQDGWPSAAYAVSKAGETAVTMVLARLEAAAEGRGSVRVNACCPGFVNTDMTKGRGTKSVDQGAETPVLLALGEIGGTTGEFWKDGEVVAWSG